MDAGILGSTPRSRSSAWPLTRAPFGKRDLLLAGDRKQVRVMLSWANTMGVGQKLR